MSVRAPERLPIFAMGEWPVEQAEAAIEAYIQAGPDAIAWLEDMAGQSFVGRAGLDAAWAWTVDAIRDDGEIDMWKLRFAVVHVWAREAFRREPRMRWGRYDHALKQRLLGYNAPAIGIEDAQMIPAQIVANIAGHVDDSRTKELPAGPRDSLKPEKLSENLDRFIESIYTRGILARDLAPDRPSSAYPRSVDVPTTLLTETPTHWATDGAAALAALDAGVDLWSSEVIDNGDDEEPSFTVDVVFDDVFAGYFSAAIDAVTTALQNAHIPGGGDVYREDRELIVVSASDEGTAADKQAIDAIGDRALRDALKTFGPARDE
jgi:hypothetical protein